MRLDFRGSVSGEKAWRLFLRQPVPTYIVDLKPVLKGLRALEFASLIGLDEHLIKHPELARAFLNKVKVLAANPAALELVEAHDEQDFIENFPDFFIDESIRALRSSLLQVADGKDEFEESTPIITRSGRKLVVHFYMRPVYDGDLSQVICNFIEVSHWKRAEEALWREQETLKGSPVFSFRWRNAEGWPVESVSPNIVQLGYTPEDLLSGKVPFAEIVHSGDLQRVADEVAQYSATGQGGFEQDYRVHTSSGEIRWMYDYTSIVRNEDGEITHYDGFLLDITSRKLAEQKLAESECMLSSILDNAPIGIWLQDMNGRLRFVNDAFCNSVGITEERFLAAEHYCELYPQEVSDRCVASDEKAMSCLDPVTSHETLQFVDGELHDLDIVKAQVLGEDGKPQGIIGLSFDVTARKKAEQALRASERRYQDIFETNPVSIWVEDISQVIPVYEQLRREGITDFKCYFEENPAKVFELAALTGVIDVNAATLEMFEAESKEQLLGSLDKVFVEESLEGSIAVHAALAEGQRVFEVETINQTLKGNTLHVLIKMNLPEDPDYSNALVTLVDITVRKRMEEKLSASENELATIFGNMQDTYYRTDAKGALVRLGPGVKDMLGYDVGELMGVQLSSLYTNPDKRDEFLQDMKKLGGKVSGYQISMLHKNGAPVWVSTSSQFIYDSEGEVVGVEGIARDITDVVIATQSLEQSEKRLSEANRIAKMGHIYRNIDADTMVWSKEVYEILGISDTSEPANGEVFLSCIAEDEREKIMQDVEDGIHSGNGCAHSFSIRDLSGNTKFLESKAEITVVDGERHMVGYVRDVTQLRKEQEELRQARDLAEQASRLKSDFLANMSHEIRTPMNGLVGFVNLLSRTDLDSEQRDYLETMKTSMGDLLAIINDILDFSRIESNKLTIHYTEFDLLEAVSDVINLFSASADVKRLELGMVLGEKVPLTVEGDPVRLRQVLSNLIGNAIKFTDKGEVNLRVTLDSNHGDDFIIRFQIEDTGAGIAQSDIKHLFNAFTQFHTGRAGGAGLGLAISSRLVELMGGDISVRPRDGGGSIFSFTLPLKRLHQQARVQPPHLALELREYAGKRVLVVDDNAINRKLITTLLRKMGVETVEAEDGHGAISCYEGDNFDLIMMDIRMPGMDGVEATRQIRLKESRHQRIPIVALTAHALQHERENFILAGMDDCLTKPVREEDLFGLLEGYMG